MNTVCCGHDTFVGLDGFLFSSNDNRSYNVHMVQIKSGRLNISHTNTEVVMFRKKAVCGIQKLSKMVLSSEGTTVKFCSLTFGLIKNISTQLLEKLTSDLHVSIGNDANVISVNVVEQRDFVNYLDDDDMECRLSKWMGLHV